MSVKHVFNQMSKYYIMLEQNSIKHKYPMILKLQFEICLEIGHDLKLF